MLIVTLLFVTLLSELLFVVDELLTELSEDKSPPPNQLPIHLKSQPTVLSRIHLIALMIAFKISRIGSRILNKTSKTGTMIVLIKLPIADKIGAIALIIVNMTSRISY